LGGERTCDSDIEDKEPLSNQDTAESDNDPHTGQSEFHKEPIRAVDPNGSLMHGTDRRSGTVIPCTDSRSGAVIPFQNQPRAINRSRAMMHGTDSRLRAVNPDSNTERIGLGVDLQIANNSNRQQRPRRSYRPTFKVWENQLITEILQKSIDPRNKHALIVLISK
jgi:hypothetical protein